MANPKSTFLPYTPASPPAAKDGNTCRATWDEFYKLAQALLDMDRPVAMAIAKTETVAVQATEVWIRLFDAPVARNWEAPLGQLDNAGIWTCPQEGLYSITVIIEVPSFPSPGARLYTAALRTTFAGTAAASLLSYTGGPDEAPLRLVSNFLRPLARGDTAAFDLDLTEEGYTGSVPVLCILNVSRVSGTR